MSLVAFPVASAVAWLARLAVAEACRIESAVFVVSDMIHAPLVMEIQRTKSNAILRLNAKIKRKGMNFPEEAHPRRKQTIAR
jgi:hypothetical protein